MVVKKLRKGGLIQSYRGPGGGYLMQQPLKQLSVWDVVSCFDDKETPAPTHLDSPEKRAMLEIAAELESVMRAFTTSYSLLDAIDESSLDDIQVNDATRDRSGIKHMPTSQALPRAIPNSVFELAKLESAAYA